MSDIDPQILFRDTTFASVAASIASLTLNTDRQDERWHKMWIALTSLKGTAESAALITSSGIKDNLGVMTLTYARDLLGLFMVGADANTSEEILTLLASSPNPHLRTVIAFNTSTPSGVLDKLSHDEEDGVRYGVLSNPSTPIETIASMPPWNDDKIQLIAITSHNLPDRQD